MVAEAFPESRLILGQQRDTPNPLGALPQIEMRDKEPCGTAVFGCKVLVVESERNPRLPVPQVLERQIRSVVTVGVNHGVGRVSRYAGKEGVERNAFPGSTELGPPGDTVQVCGEGLRGKTAK